MSIVYAGGKYGYAYSINSSHTSYNQFQLAFTKQTRSASEPVASMWFINKTPGVFDIDTQYELTPGTFSPRRYDYYASEDEIFTDMSSLDNINDSASSRLMLLGNANYYRSSIASGLNVSCCGYPLPRALIRVIPDISFIAKTSAICLPL